MTYFYGDYAAPGVRDSLCSVEDCIGNARSRGMCATHYQSARRSGTLPRMSNHAQIKTFRDGCRCDYCWDRCPHGTRNAYTNWACRCAECRKANADHRRSYARKRNDASRTQQGEQ